MWQKFDALDPYQSITFYDYRFLHLSYSSAEFMAL